MSGHSKWSTIKHKKAAADSKRGKIFGEVGRMIRIAVKEGKSGDPNQNPALRVALEKARAANMPKVNVERAIEKGLGKSKSGASIEEVTYEGYGPGGVGLMVQVVTDNRNRTGSEIRNMLEKAGGSLGSPGSTSYLFELQNGGTYQIKVPMPLTNEQDINKLNQLVEALENHDDVEMVTTNLQAEA